MTDGRLRIRGLPFRPESLRGIPGSRRALKRGFSVVVPVTRSEDGKDIRIRNDEGIFG